MGSLQSDNKKILILSQDRYSVCLEKLKESQEIGLNKAQKTTSTSKSASTPFTLFIIDARIDKNGVSLNPSLQSFSPFYTHAASNTSRPASKHRFFISSHCHHGNFQCPTWASLCFQRFTSSKPLRFLPPLFSMPKKNCIASLMVTHGVQLLKCVLPVIS